MCFLVTLKTFINFPLGEVSASSIVPEMPLRYLGDMRAKQGFRCQLVSLHVPLFQSMQPLSSHEAPHPLGELGFCRQVSGLGRKLLASPQLFSGGASLSL